jgi:CRISPR-associated protein Csx17
VVLKWLFLPGPSEIRAEEAIVPLLCANRIAEACEVAQRRLRCVDMMPRRIAFENSNEPGYGVRLAAALLLPVEPETLKKIESKSLFHEKKVEHV